MNRLFVEQFNQLAIMDMTRGSQQRQLVPLDTVCRDSIDLRNQCRGHSRSRASMMTRQSEVGARQQPVRM